MENLLDQQEIDEADRVFVQDRLRELRQALDMDEKRERQVWSSIKARAGSFLASPSAARIVETLVTSAVRSQLEGLRA